MRFSAALPFGHMTTPVELRHLYFEERLNITFAGMRFHNISGAVQRQVERFVYQLLAPHTAGRQVAIVTNTTVDRKSVV